MRRLASAVLVLATVLGLAAPAGAEELPVAERVLVLSLPTLSWEDVNTRLLPNINRLLDESAVASFSHRAVDRRTTPGDAYASMSSGTKADGDPDLDPLAFGVGEPYQGEPAEEIFTRRTGAVVEEGLFSLAAIALNDTSDLTDFDAEVGALGDALLEAGRHPAVIANADGSEELPESERGRQAVIGLMDGEGRVPAGQVGRSLLESDPSAPFGHQLDPDQVVGTFEEVWVDGAVVLVEGSDLVRADVYRELTSSEQGDNLRDIALRRTDELVGRLLDEVDPERDAVLLVAPFPREGTEELTVTGVRAPGLEPGLAKSAVTRRSGFVTTADVGPTILALSGVEIPSVMDGRPYERSGTGGSAQDRREWLEEVNDAALWRDKMLVPVAAAFVVAQLVLWVVAVRALDQRRRRLRAGVEVAALAVLAVLPLSFLASLFPFHDWGAAAYWAFLVLGGALVGLLARTLLTRWPADPLIAVLAFILGLLTIDSLVADRVQLNAVFGHTPTLAGRFSGIPNMAFAMIAASAILLAGLIASRMGPKRGRPVALLLMVVVLIIDASPFWGSDVGGALTLVPVIAVMAAVMYDFRISLKSVVLMGLGTVVVFLVAGFVDLARPEESRSHLGRLFEDIADNGLEALVTVMLRKGGAIIGVLDTSVWTLMLPVVFGFILYLIWRAPGRLQGVQALVAEERAARVGFVVCAVLGFAVNDSGITVPGLMLGVMNASLVFLVVRAEDVSGADGAEGPGGIEGPEGTDGADDADESGGGPRRADAELQPV